MPEKEWEPANVFELFGDHLVRAILVSASERPRSADWFADRLDVSLPTVYRRTNELVEYDLLTEHLRADESKHQYRVFETTVETVCYEIADGGTEVEIVTKNQFAGRYEASWTESRRRNVRESTVRTTDGGESETNERAGSGSTSDAP